MAAYARVLATRGSRAAAALAPSVAALGQPAGRTCPRRAAAPHAPTLPLYRHGMLFGTGVGFSNGVGFPNGGGGFPGGGRGVVPGGGHGVVPDGGCDVVPGGGHGVVPGGGRDVVPGGGHGVVPDGGCDVVPGGGHGVVPDGGRDVVPGGGHGVVPDGSRDVVPGGGGGGPCGNQGGCRFDAKWLERRYEEILKRELKESVGATDKLAQEHFQGFRSALHGQMKSLFRKNLLWSLVGFFLEFVIVLIVGVVLGVWLAFDLFKNAADHLRTTEGAKMVIDFLDPIFDHIEERYPRITWVVGSRKVEKPAAEKKWWAWFRKEKKPEDKPKEKPEEKRPEDKPKPEEKPEEKLPEDKPEEKPQEKKPEVEKPAAEKKWWAWFRKEKKPDDKPEEKPEEKRPEEKKPEVKKLDE